MGINPLCIDLYMSSPCFCRQLARGLLPIQVLHDGRNLGTEKGRVNHEKSCELQKESMVGLR